MTVEPLPGRHSARALRALGFGPAAIAAALRRQLGLDTGEVARVLQEADDETDTLVMTDIDTDAARARE